jgi:tetratricopeptide (TPR) repeat protein
MPSLIPGYEYDIFISYRQKDNKGDKWVSRFVEALKTELEATFKEDVSVYFDENPHDRLQETHNVDKSLEGKLRCLIFIPVLSQTYCDPISYAWQYEFLAFLRIAENDRFGKDVKLRSGNVASRILPIRIHDLEQEDIKLYEKETGSVLRALDFVFKTSTGVSRPLKDNEDHPHDNLNKTFYSDQINKVGHSIKEIIIGMKSEPAHLLKETVFHIEMPQEVKKADQIGIEVKPAKSFKIMLIIGAAILAFLILAAILAFPKIFKYTTIEKLRSSDGRISIVVMPFQNMTNDTIWNVWQDGIQNELITSLTNSAELRVKQTESINSILKSNSLNNYASLTPSLASAVSQKLDATVFIYGSIKQVGKTIRVNAQLIDSKTEDTFKSFQIDGTAENILYTIDSLSKITMNFLIISKLEKEVNPDFKHLVSSNSPEAYRYFIYGKNAFYGLDYPLARNMLLKAVSIDSNLFYPYILLSFAYGNKRNYDQAKEWALKAYKKGDQLSVIQKTIANWTYSTFFETPYEAIKYIQQLQSFDDQPMNYFRIGNCYLNLHQYNKAIPEFEKALEIYNKWGSKPMWVINYINLGIAYHNSGQFAKENELYIQAEKDFPDVPDLIFRQVILSLTQADTVTANIYIKKFISICKIQSLTEADITNDIASMYSEAGILDKAEESYRQALSLEPYNPSRMDTLAYFLIDKDRDINGGLELVDKALNLDPDNYNYLNTKGWGVYKQGKYKEALEILQKSWDLRREKAVYDHEAYLHLVAAKKPVTGQKN